MKITKFGMNMHQKDSKSMSSPIAQDTVAYKGYEYNYSKGQHKLAYPQTGSVYYLTNTFAEDYVPQLSEIMDVIDSWIDWSA
jgi:hypothetical protein